MTERNTIARAADQRVAHKTDDRGFELTIHDKGHSPSWRRPGSRGQGEITVRAGFENGLPVIKIRIVEGYNPGAGEKIEYRESTFDLIGSSAIETFEALRTIMDTGGGFIKGNII